MSKQKFTAWVTKYALTEGIKVVDASLCHVDTMISYGGKCGQYAHGNDWHRNEVSALNRAAEMRIKKINSLKRQIEKLESLDIKINDDRAGK